LLHSVCYIRNDQGYGKGLTVRKAKDEGEQKKSIQQNLSPKNPYNQGAEKYHSAKKICTPSEP
jgi:hypothetical protein